MSEYVFRPRPGSPLRLTVGQVADWFLDLHIHWFTTQSNDLYQRRGKCRMALVRYLRTGDAPPEGTPTGYVVMKFRTEVEEWFVRETAT